MPKEFGKFKLLEGVGKGGMGVVYRAVDSDTGRIVALKVFPSDEERAPEVSCRLRDREVRMLVSVRHPNVVKFFESGYVGDDYYYTMEFVEESLLRFMRSDRELALADKVHILRQTAGGLCAFHQQGIVHRDVKPGNILLDHDPGGAVHVKLTDLGIAKNVREPDIVREQTHRQIPGTPKYLSPEMIRMRPLDGRSDIFSLGVLAYEFLTGEAPFTSPDSRGYLKANIEQEPTPPRRLNPDMPTFLSDMVLRMLAVEPEDRYDSEVLARDLELAHQHLISGAPLEERTNPASMFYLEPPESQQEETAPPRAISPVSWALAGAIVLAGALLTALLWPAGPAGQLEPDAPASSAFQQAEVAFRQGRHWQALSLLQEAGPDHELAHRVRAALAERLFNSAASMLQDDRPEEAEVVLVRMRRLFPHAEHTAALAEKLRSQEGEARWERQLDELRLLARRGSHRDALEAARQLHAEQAENPERRAAVARATDEALALWGRHLVRSDGAGREIEEFLQAVADSSEIAERGPPQGMGGRLYLRLAERHAAAGDYRAALRSYELAAASRSEEVAHRASEAARNLRRRLQARPVSAVEAAEQIAGAGFLADLWEALGPQQVRDGVLRLGEGDSQALRRTMRPVRNLGFRVEVQFRAGEGMLDRGEAGRCGLGIEDARGRAYRLSFDADGYGVAAGRGQTFAAARMRAARGDEEETWRTLGFHYDFDVGRLKTLLDGAEIAAHDVDLGDVRVFVFWEPGRNGVAPPEFRNINLRP